MLRHGSPISGSLVLLAHEEEVKDCLQWLDSTKTDTRIVALTPFAMYALDRAGIHYRLPEDYYEPQELYQMGVGSFRRVELLCDTLDRIAQTVYPSLAELSIAPAWSSFYDVKYMYDSVMIVAFQLRRMLDAEKPASIIAYGNTECGFRARATAPPLFFDNRESLYAQLLTLGKWNAGVELLAPVAQPMVRSSRRLDIGRAVRREVVRFLNRHPALLDTVLAVRRDGLRASLEWMRSRPGTRALCPALLCGDGYNWAESRRELSRQGIAPVYRMDHSLPRLERAARARSTEIPEEVWNVWSSKPELREPFVHEGIDCFPLVEERLRFLPGVLGPACEAVHTAARAFMLEKRIRVVIASTLATCMAHSVARAAHSIGVPVVTWQHGGNASEEHPIIHYADLMDSDAHFVWGEGVAQQLSEAAKKFNTRLIPVGSAMLDRLRRLDDPAARVAAQRDTTTRPSILYVTTNYYQSNRLISVFPPFSDNLLWRTQQAIVDVLGRHTDCQVTIKLHPSSLYREPPLRVHARERGFRHLRFVRDEQPFTILLSAADVVVCDLPSTTLLQALTTSKPVFVYLGHQRISKSAQELLERRAFCCLNLECFTAVLDGFLTNGATTASKPNDTEFLEMFGTMSPEETAASRAARDLKRILVAPEGGS